MFEEKVVDLQVCFCLGVGEERRGIGPAAGHSAEVNGVEVDNVKDVLYIHIDNIDAKGVLRVLRGTSINDNVLLTVLNSEIVDGNVVL